MDLQTVTALIEASQETYRQQTPLYYTLGVWAGGVLLAYSVISFIMSSIKPLSGLFIGWLWSLILGYMGFAALTAKNPALSVYYGSVLEVMAEHRGIHLKIDDWCQDTEQCLINEENADKPAKEIAAFVWALIQRDLKPGEHH